MPTPKDKLRKKVIKALRPKGQITVPAVLGNYAGAVSTGKPFQVYARLVSGEVVKVVNQIAPNTWDLKVTLGKRDGQRFWQVIGVRDAYGDLPAPNVSEHSSEHRYLPIYRDQMIPLLLFPIQDTLTAQLFGSIVVCNGVFVSVENQIVDFASSVPANGARWVLVEYDTTGAVAIVNGDIVESKEILTISDVPTVPDDHYPIGAVRLYTGQSEFKYLDDFLYPFGVGEASHTAYQYRVYEDVYVNDCPSDDPFTQTFNVLGALYSASNIAYFVCHADCELESIMIHVISQGTLGETVLDAKKNGVSIFPISTMPTVPFDSVTGTDERNPDTVSLAKGDILSFDIIDIATGSADLLISLRGANIVPLEFVTVDGELITTSFLADLE